MQYSDETEPINILLTKAKGRLKTHSRLSSQSFHSLKFILCKIRWLGGEVQMPISAELHSLASPVRSYSWRSPVPSPYPPQASFLLSTSQAPLTKSYVCDFPWRFGVTRVMGPGRSHDTYAGAEWSLLNRWPYSLDWMCIARWCVQTSKNLSPEPVSLLVPSCWKRLWQPQEVILWELQEEVVRKTGCLVSPTYSYQGHGISLPRTDRSAWSTLQSSRVTQDTAIPDISQPTALWCPLSLPQSHGALVVSWIRGQVLGCPKPHSLQNPPFKGYILNTCMMCISQPWPQDSSPPSPGPPHASPGVSLGSACCWVSLPLLASPNCSPLWRAF